MADDTHTPRPPEARRMKGLAEKLQKIRCELDLTEEIRLGDLRLRLGILRALEEAKATSYAQRNGTGDNKGMFLWYLKLGVLAMAVRSIDDLDLSGLKADDPVPEEKSSRFDFVLAILKDLPGDVVDHLYAVYTGMVGQGAQALERAAKLPKIPDIPKVKPPPPPPTETPEREAEKDEDEGSFKDAE